MKIYREVGSLYIVNRKDAEGYVRPVYEIEVDEAEPIRHGHWTRPRRPRTYERFCSCCGEKSWYCGIGDYNYCPNCGAKMDEVTDGRR